MIKKLKKGQLYKTRGGWTAVCIWVNTQNDIAGGGYCIHKPGDKSMPGEEGPIYHWKDGTAHAMFAITVFEPPVYKVGHPADLMKEIKKEEE